MTTIFISYRREDSADVTGRIYDRLAEHFGKTEIFKDVDNIPLGVDFKTHLANAVGECEILLAVIGRSWAHVEDEKNEIRLLDPNDFVRLEIESALERGIRVVPVLVGGAGMPGATDLPHSVLQKLTTRSGISIRPDPDFHADMDRLIAGLSTTDVEPSVENLDNIGSEESTPRTSQPKITETDKGFGNKDIQLDHGRRRGWLRYLFPLAILLLIGWLSLKFFGSDVTAVTTKATVTATEETSESPGGMDVDVGALGADIQEIFSVATETLSGITDEVSATEALPQLEEISMNLAGVNEMFNKVPESARGPLTDIVRGGMEKFGPIAEKVQALPGVGPIVGKFLDPVLEMLNGMEG